MVLTVHGISSEVNTQKRRNSWLMARRGAKDLLACFVKENDTVKHRQKIYIRYRPRGADETEMRYTFYAAASPDVIFVHRPWVTEIGSIVVYSPDTRQGLDRDI
ncbi:hypothetical protein OS493_034749 [Desmophyllum pertusum]|uniref:Uncharacterized protein n=1 Tax=Desmophyllum pertusum TaxID=174260 RepID=A0A9X0CN98_9CNID|nr:hypothetical protein OS493_034749 [Desmophyllum pertusum]